MHIPSNLKYLRNKNSFTQINIADKLGISKDRYGTYERGIYEPNIDILIKISQIYNVSIDSLILTDLTDYNIVKDLQDLILENLTKSNSDNNTSVDVLKELTKCLEFLLELQKKDIARLEGDAK